MADSDSDGSLYCGAATKQQHPVNELWNAWKNKGKKTRDALNMKPHLENFQALLVITAQEPCEDMFNPGPSKCTCLQEAPINDDDELLRLKYF